jgi:hypothetical protein
MFTDVDFPDATTIEYFDVNGATLGKFSVPSIIGNETFSFLGVNFFDPIISKVRITTGTEALSSNSTSGDVVVMDDFIYGKPIASTVTPVPEPSTVSILIMSLIGLLSFGWIKSNTNYVA